MVNDVESHSLGKRSTHHNLINASVVLPALSNGDNVSLLHVKARRAVSGDVAVSLFVTSNEKIRVEAQFLPSVLLDISEVVTADNDGALHLGGDDQSLQDGTTNRDGGGEGALLIDVLSLDGGLGGLDAKSHISVPALVGLLAHQMDLAVREHLLLLESSLILQNVNHFIHWTSKGKAKTKG